MKQIGVLPDDILLEIFDFYLDHMHMSISQIKTEVEVWHLLVHVCRRWRSLIFRSPRRLNLRLYCTHKTPARDTLDVWPAALPLIVSGNGNDMTSSPGVDNIVVALGQSNRVCQIHLSGPQLEQQVLAAMHVPFPELTDLRIFSDDETLPVIPDSFLGRSTATPSRLRSIRLMRIPLPGLPKVLLSAHHLVTLWLYHIPHSGYIPPEAMVVLLGALSNLKKLSLEFESPKSRPDVEGQSLPLPKRSILPALHEFHFKGVTEYLEELLTGIDIPQLDEMNITFFNQIDFDCPRLAQFINRTPTLRAPEDARMQFSTSTASVQLWYWKPTFKSGALQISISCREPDWQLSSIEQVCNSPLHPLSKVEDLYIGQYYPQLSWKDDAIENALWLRLLLPFTAVKNLYLSKVFGPGIVAALQELVGDRITEVLPSLRNIFVEGIEQWGPFQENIGQFAAARRRSGHPIAISGWLKR